MNHASFMWQYHAGKDIPDGKRDRYQGPWTGLPQGRGVPLDDPGPWNSSGQRRMGTVGEIHRSIRAHTVLRRERRRHDLPGRQARHPVHPPFLRGLFHTGIQLQWPACERLLACFSERYPPVHRPVLHRTHLIAAGAARPGHGGARAHTFPAPCAAAALGRIR